MANFQTLWLQICGSNGCFSREVFLSWFPSKNLSQQASARPPQISSALSRLLDKHAKCCKAMKLKARKHLENMKGNISSFNMIDIEGSGMLTHTKIQQFLKDTLESQPQFNVAEHLLQVYKSPFEGISYKRWTTIFWNPHSKTPQHIRPFTRYFSPHRATLRISDVSTAGFVTRTPTNFVRGVGIRNTTTLLTTGRQNHRAKSVLNATPDVRMFAQSYTAGTRHINKPIHGNYFRVGKFPAEFPTFFTEPSPRMNSKRLFDTPQSQQRLLNRPPSCRKSSLLMKKRSFDSPSSNISTNKRLKLTPQSISFQSPSCSQVRKLKHSTHLRSSLRSQTKFLNGERSCKKSQVFAASIRGSPFGCSLVSSKRGSQHSPKPFGLKTLIPQQETQKRRSLAHSSQQSKVNAEMNHDGGNRTSDSSGETNPQSSNEGNTTQSHCSLRSRQNINAERNLHASRLSGSFNFNKSFDKYTNSQLISKNKIFKRSCSALSRESDFPPLTFSMLMSTRSLESLDQRQKSKELPEKLSSEVSTNHTFSVNPEEKISGSNVCVGDRYLRLSDLESLPAENLSYSFCGTDNQSFTSWSENAI